MTTWLPILIILVSTGGCLMAMALAAMAAQSNRRAARAWRERQHWHRLTSDGNWPNDEYLRQREQDRQILLQCIARRLNRLNTEQLEAWAESICKGEIPEEL